MTLLKFPAAASPLLRLFGWTGGGRQCPGSFGQAVDGAFEGRSVGGIDGFEQASGEFKRARRKVAIDRAPGRRQRQKLFPAVGTVLAADDQLAPLERTNGA